MSVNRIRPVEERLDALLVGRVVDRRVGPAGLPDPLGQADGGERLVVEREELPGGRPRPVDRVRCSGYPLRPGQTERDGQLHVRRRGLGQRGPVDELDHGVDDRLRVDHDVDPLEGDVEQQVGLDDLQALVDQGGGVGRDDRSHGPGGVRQGLLGSDVEELVAAHPPERSAAGRDDEALHLVGRPAAEALREGRVLAVDRHDLSRLRGGLDQRAPDDERLLVGQGQRCPGVQRRERRCQADRAGDAVEDDVGRAAGQVAAASGPASSSGRYAARPASRAASATAAASSSTDPRAQATASTCRSTAWRASSVRLPPALSAVMRNRSGAAATTSIAWVPMDPVDPSRVTVRGEEVTP